MVSGARLHYVHNNAVIALLGKRVDNSYQPIDLDYRVGLLDLAVTGDKIFVSSQNVVSIFPKQRGQSEVDALTDYLDDYEPQSEQTYGYEQMATFVRDTLVVGTRNFSTGENNLYAIPVTAEILQSKNGVRASPQLLLKNSFVKGEVYATGNPITAVPREDLEKIIERAS